MNFSKKTGKVKLGRRDYRIGNFVVTDEGEHLKVSDINGMVSHRFSTGIAKGQLMKMMLAQARGGDAAARKSLEAYCVVFFNLLSCVPFTLKKEGDDFDFLSVLNDATVECVKRNRGVYGLQEDISKEADDRILDEVKEVSELEEKIDGAL